MPSEKENVAADLVAPKYNDLFNAVQELKGKLREMQASSSSNPGVVQPNVDYRILPDVGLVRLTDWHTPTSGRSDID